MSLANHCSLPVTEYYFCFRKMNIEGFDNPGIFHQSIKTLDEVESKLNEIVKYNCKLFLLQFIQNNVYIYRDQLQNQFYKGEKFINISAEHLELFDQFHGTETLHNIKKKPHLFVPLMEEAASDAIFQLTQERPDNFQICLSPGNVFPTLSLRDINSSNVGSLVTVRGLVVSADAPSAKAKIIAMKCSTCGTVKHNVQIPDNGYFLPRRCLTSSKCRDDPYVILHDKVAIHNVSHLF